MGQGADGADENEAEAEGKFVTEESQEIFEKVDKMEKYAGDVS